MRFSSDSPRSLLGRGCLFQNKFATAAKTNLPQPQREWTLTHTARGWTASWGARHPPHAVPPTAETPNHRDPEGGRVGLPAGGPASQVAARRPPTYCPSRPAGPPGRPSRPRSCGRSRGDRKSTTRGCAAPYSCRGALVPEYFIEVGDRVHG